VKIVFCTASRSERGLSEPLIQEFRKSGRFNVEVLELPLNFKGAFEAAEEYIRVKGKPDLAFVSYDRLEMLGACLAFFIKGVKLAQCHAGEVSGSGEVYDDFVRHMITLCSDFQFCVSRQAYTRCLHFLTLLGKPTDKLYYVGSYAFDNVKLDYSLVPKEPFNLVVYNPLSRRADLIPKELDEIEALIGERLTLWVYPNEDEEREIVIERIKKLEKAGKVKGLPTISRPQFLALLEKAERVIGNSSSFFLELPYWNKQHIHVGLRNKNRERIKVEPGASRRIVEIVEKFFCQES
jgi:UDP-N-acetylglucosamine 2-epimerase (non-hydrolysing)/GDP/UDP-N,N'-diacetylbacillosamine 2-epimerase (hydrolysing)